MTAALLVVVVALALASAQTTPRRYLSGGEADIGRVVSEISALIPRLPTGTRGMCAKQRYSRMCACSSGVKFNNETATFVPGAELLGALKSESELLTFFRNMCLVDESIHAMAMRILCALEQRPCDAEGDEIAAVDARKLCRSDCLMVNQRLEALTANLKLIIEALFRSNEAINIDPAELPVRCLQLWTNFTGSCRNDEFFSDDAATCLPMPENTTDIAAPLYGWRRRLCLVHETPAAANCRTDAQFEAAKCLGTDGKTYPALMSTSVIQVQVSDQVGSMRATHKASGESLGFRVLRIANAETNAENNDILRWVEKSIAGIKPTLTCGDFGAMGPREINATFALSPTCSATLRYIVADTARRIPVAGHPEIDFSIPADAAKVSAVVVGAPFTAVESAGTDSFIVEFAVELAPFGTIVPTFNHPTLYKPTYAIIGEERLDLELSETQMRYQMPLVAVSDGVSERFDIGLARFTEFAQHYKGRACPSIPFEARMGRFERSIDIDPSLELIVDGYVDEAERTRIDDELTAREMESPAPDESDNTTAVAVSIVVVLLLLIGGGGLVFWLHRSGRLKLRTERGGVQ